MPGVLVLMTLPHFLHPRRALAVAMFLADSLLVVSSAF